MAHFFRPIIVGLLLGLALSAPGFSFPPPGRSNSDTPSAGNPTSATLISVVAALSTASPGPNGSERVVEPTAIWGSGPTTLAPAFLQHIAESKARRLARQTYLDAEARSYGATVGLAAQSDRDTAAALFEFIDSQQRYVQNLQLQDLTVLPVGMKLPTSGGNGTVEMGILKASFFADHAELSVFCGWCCPPPTPTRPSRSVSCSSGPTK